MLGRPEKGHRGASPDIPVSVCSILHRPLTPCRLRAQLGVDHRIHDQSRRLVPAQLSIRPVTPLRIILDDVQDHVAIDEDRHRQYRPSELFHEFVRRHFAFPQTAHRSPGAPLSALLKSVSARSRIHRACHRQGENLRASASMERPWLAACMRSFCLIGSARFRMVRVVLIKGKIANASIAVNASIRVPTPPTINSRF